MARFWDSRLWLKILLPPVVIAFLGIAASPHEARHQLDQARQSLSSDHPLEAAAHLAQAAVYWPWRDDLWPLAGRYALSGGDPQGAVAYFERAAALSAADRILLGEAYHQLGDSLQAIAQWQSALSQGGEAGAIYPLLLEVHRSQGDYAAAIEDLTVLAGLFPNQGEYLCQLALLWSSRDPETALPYLERAAELSLPQSGLVAEIRRTIEISRFSGEPAYSLLSVGRTLALQGEWLLAGEAFRQAVLQRPDYAEAWAFLGEARQHAHQDGWPDLQKALSLSPDSSVVNSLASLYWERQGDFDRALEYMTAAAQADPANAALRSEIGRLLGEKGDLPAAQAAYEQAIALAPDHSVSWRSLAEFSLRYRIQVRQIALPAARRALQLAADDPANLDVMGQALLMLGDALTAERFLRRALQQDDRYLAAELHLGQAYLLQGEWERARQQWQRVAAQAPDSPSAAQARQLLAQYFP